MGERRPRPGSHRRLTLAPGALSPEPGTSTGSRFSALGVEEEDLASEALAISVASDVFLEEREVSRIDVQRPVRSESDLLQEFWS